MVNDNSLSRRELLVPAGAAALAALGVAILPSEASAALKDYPALNEGHASLINAKKHLENGKEEFNGHRKKAIEHVNMALEEIKKAVKFADKK